MHEANFSTLGVVHFQTRTRRHPFLLSPLVFLSKQETIQLMKSSQEMMEEDVDGVPFEEEFHSDMVLLKSTDKPDQDTSCSGRFLGVTELVQ